MMELYASADGVACHRGRARSKRAHSALSQRNGFANSASDTNHCRICGSRSCVVPITSEPRHVLFMPRSDALSQRECVQRHPALDAHILLSVDHVGHGAGGNGWSEIGLPQELAIAGIEGEELAVAAAREQHIRSGGEHAAFGRRSRHTEGPFPLSGFRIHGDDGAEYVIGCGCAAGPSAGEALAVVEFWWVFTFAVNTGA